GGRRGLHRHAHPRGGRACPGGASGKVPVARALEPQHAATGGDSQAGPNARARTARGMLFPSHARKRQQVGRGGAAARVSNPSNLTMTESFAELFEQRSEEHTSEL